MNRLERAVLLEIGENPDSPDAFADISPIRNSINDAIAEIIMATGSCKRLHQVALEADKQFYSLSISGGEIAWITDAFLLTRQRRLEQTDFDLLIQEDQRFFVYNGVPTRYVAIDNDLVFFHPITSSDTDVVELTIVAIPSEYTQDADRLFVRRDFERGVVHYAVSEYWASRGDAKEAVNHHAMYLDLVGLRRLFPQAQEYHPRFATVKGERNTEYSKGIMA